MAADSLPEQLVRTRHFARGVPERFTVMRDETSVLFLRGRHSDDPVSCLWALDLDSGRERLLADPAELTSGQGQGAGRPCCLGPAGLTADPKDTAGARVSSPTPPTGPPGSSPSRWTAGSGHSTSPAGAARRLPPGLRRPLLLVQGLADTNVHPAHTGRLSAALLAAGRPHEVLYLPGVGHQTVGHPLTGQMLRHQARFLCRHLDAGPAPRRGSAPWDGSAPPDDGASRDAAPSRTGMAPRPGDGPHRTPPP